MSVEAPSEWPATTTHEPIIVSGSTGTAATTTIDATPQPESPPSWSLIEPQSWADVLRLVDELEKVHPFWDRSYFFRGHYDSTWALTPSLLRSLRSLNVTNEEEAHSIENRTIAEFRKQAHIFFCHTICSCA
jgi:hypothetical protein